MLYVYEKIPLAEFSLKKGCSVMENPRKIVFEGGNRRHKKCTQIIICINGACEVETNNGRKREENFFFKQS